MVGCFHDEHILYTPRLYPSCKLIQLINHLEKNSKEESIPEYIFKAYPYCFPLLGKMV